MGSCLRSPLRCHWQVAAVASWEPGNEKARRDGGQQGKQPAPPLCAKNRRSLCLSTLAVAFKGSFIVEVKSFGQREINSDATMCDKGCIYSFKFQELLPDFGAY